MQTAPSYCNKPHNKSMQPELWAMAEGTLNQSFWLGPTSSPGNKIRAL